MKHLFTILALLITLATLAALATPALAAKPKPTPTPIVVKQPELLTAHAIRWTICIAPLTGKVVYKRKGASIRIVGQGVNGFLTSDMLVCPTKDFKVK